MSKLWMGGIATILLWSAAAVAAPDTVTEAATAVLEGARVDCRAFDNGNIEIRPQAVSRIDLTGDGKSDEIVDFRHLACPTAASLFCGTGGCSVTAIVNNEPVEFLAKDWKVIAWDAQPILLLAVHGSQCGGTNLRKCFKALVWSEGGFRSVVP